MTTTGNVSEHKLPCSHMKTNNIFHHTYLKFRQLKHTPSFRRNLCWIAVTYGGSDNAGIMNFIVDNKISIVMQS